MTHSRSSLRLAESLCDLQDCDAVTFAWTSQGAERVQPPFLEENEIIAPRVPLWRPQCRVGNKGRFDRLIRGEGDCNSDQRWNSNALAYGGQLCSDRAEAKGPRILTWLRGLDGPARQDRAGEIAPPQEPPVDPIKELMRILGEQEAAASRQTRDVLRPSPPRSKYPVKLRQTAVLRFVVPGPRSPWLPPFAP